MNSYSKKSKEIKHQSVASVLSKQQYDHNETFQLVDNRTKSITLSSSKVVQRMPPKYKKDQKKADKAMAAGDKKTAIKAKEKELKGRAELDAEKRDPKHIKHTAKERGKLEREKAKLALEEKEKRDEGMRIKVPTKPMKLDEKGKPMVSFLDKLKGK
ncbi:hypothetical protein [Kordia sp.]|uniref:hypothetical protein n=1 Tax=Kordia sp. TaxID=1965332 RepID=UPI0025C64ECA|nr:hypothetical protein [Kordia sp.]MCH2196901.1 hypothetical protein [Kordia sp.]